MSGAVDGGFRNFAILATYTAILRASWRFFAILRDLSPIRNLYSINRCKNREE